MWGINPLVIGQILGGVLLKDALSSKHGVPKILRDKIIAYVASREIELAKSMARSVARQDSGLYADLKNQLRNELSEEDWNLIFSL